MLWTFWRHFDDFPIQQLNLPSDEDTGGDHLVVVVEGPPGCGCGVGETGLLLYLKRLWEERGDKRSRRRRVRGK